MTKIRKAVRTKSILVKTVLIPGALLFGLSTAWCNQGSLRKRALACITNAATDSPVEVISLEQVQSLPGPVLLLDTRSEEEYEVSHISGSQLVDFKSFQQNPQALFDRLKEPAGNHAAIITYCSVGYRSAVVAEAVQKKYPSAAVYNLKGGLFLQSENTKLEGRKPDLVHGYDKLWQNLLDPDRRYLPE